MSLRSLTEAEAARRAALLAVERYDVEVDLTDLPDGTAVRCVSTVTFTCTEPGASTFVDCAARVVSATLNGAPLPPAADGRVTLPGLAARNTLRVESVQESTTDGEGVHRAVDPSDGEVYVWTSFEPDEARHVWACFDQPDLKAPHAFTVTAPAAWTVLSNSGDADVHDTGDARRWTFPPTPPLAVYNTVVNAGPLHGVRLQADGYDLGLYARRSLRSVLERDAAELFELTRQGLAFFGDAFGMPFPQGRYDQVFMPEYGGAMENYGCVTWSDEFMPWAPPTPSERQLRAKILLHEMAHMWFGNIVTMRWWDDLWLNEAFAEFAANWAAGRATEHTDTWAGHLAADKLNAYLADQGPASHPIRQPIADVAAASSIFDAITYPKGASVLHQLMRYVGEPAFIAGMRAYFARHAWGSTVLQDLFDALGTAGDRDLDAWRTGWLETAGVDRLTLHRDGGRLTLHGTGPAGPPRPQVVGVGAYRTGPGDTLERVAFTEVDVQGPSTEVGLPEATLYLVNDDDLTFATTRPDDLAALIAAAGTLPASLSRGVAVATVWDMLLAGEATAADVVRCLTGVVAVETSAPVLEAFLDLAVDAATRWAPPGGRDVLAAQVAGACRALAVHPGQPERRRAALRRYARVATAADLAWLREEAGDDLDLRWRVLTRASATGADVTGELEALEAADPDPDKWLRAVAVRAAAPDAEAKARTWQLIVERAVPVAAVQPVAEAFWQAGQDTLLAPYAQRYLQAVPHLHQGGMVPAMVGASRLFPLYGVGAGFIDDVQRAGRGAAPVVSKIIVERADLLGRMLRSRG